MDDCPLSLPELWPIIISSVERDPDLASVALVCRLWERIVRPRLVVSPNFYAIAMHRSTPNIVLVAANAVIRTPYIRVLGGTGMHEIYAWERDDSLPVDRVGLGGIMWNDIDVPEGGRVAVWPVREKVLRLSECTLQLAYLAHGNERFRISTAFVLDTIEIPPVLNITQELTHPLIGHVFNLNVAALFAGRQGQRYGAYVPGETRVKLCIHTDSNVELTA